MRPRALALGLLLLNCAATRADETLTLTYASPYSPNHTFSIADRIWIKWVEQQSHGRLHIQPIWSGALLSSDQSMLELRHGIADIGLITPIYTRGGAQLIRVQAGFYGGARTFDQQVAMYRCLEADSPEFARELSGLTILAIQGGTLPGVLTRTRAVSTLTDLRGLRLRAPTELLDVLRDLGADPVNMPMGDVYSALAKGVLDGVIAPADTLKSLHFAEVAKHFWQLEIPRGAYPARAMATRRWLALSPQDRAVLEASIPIWEQALATQTMAAVQAGETAGRQQGVEFLPVRPEDQRRFDTLYEQGGERSARSLTRYGISGIEVFRQARRIAAGISRGGQVECVTSAE
jgi:TRAP-type C4-dicarboxylate transport system substrate-binding protein